MTTERTHLLAALKSAKDTLDAVESERICAELGASIAYLKDPANYLAPDAWANIDALRIAERDAQSAVYDCEEALYAFDDAQPVPETGRVVGWGLDARFVGVES